MRAEVHQYLLDSADVTTHVAEACADDIVRAADLVADALRQGGKLLLCGNDGSAADCQHLAAEFVSRLTKDFVRPAMPAIALTTDTSFLTAYANDESFEGVFARQVEALGRPGDVLLGISTSGSSRNIVRAVEQARRRDIKVIVLTGEDGGVSRLADVAVQVPSRDTQHIQEAHLAIEHLLCMLVERHLYGHLLR